MLAFAPEKTCTPMDYIDLFKEVAIKEMQRYNIPASLTLAQAIVESNYGNSNLAVNANNYFGIKCHKQWEGDSYTMDVDEKDECFRKYENALHSYEDHSLFLVSCERYGFLFQLPKTDYIAWAKGLKAAGYTIHPKYAEMIIEIIENYKLYELDEAFLNPISYLKMHDESKAIEENNKISYLFNVLKFSETGFTISKPGIPFVSILKEYDEAANKFVKENMFYVSGENKNVEELLTEKSTYMILLTNEDFKNNMHKDNLNLYQSSEKDPCVNYEQTQVAADIFFTRLKFSTP